MNTISTSIRSFAIAGLALAAVAVVFAACGDNKPQQPGVQQNTAAPDSKHTPASSGTIDTTDGTLAVTGSGAEAGQWTLNDVSAMVDEVPAGGVTSSVLTVQAHDGLSGRHFRLRLIRDGGEMEPGTYSIPAAGGDAERKLDARWEAAGRMFVSLGRASGQVKLTAVNAERCAGTFDVNLALRAGSDTTMQHLTGSFNQRLTH
jgi:hypothetical protein